MRVREYGMLFALALIWGASFLFIKIGLREFSPATLVAGRLFFSVLTLGLVVAFNRSLIAGWRRYWRLGVLVAVVNIFLPYMLITWGETHISSGTASVLNATTPLFTVPLAQLWLGQNHEALTLRRGLGVIIGFLGVALLIGPSALDVFSGHAGDIWGEVAVLVAALCYAFGSLLSRGFTGSARLVGPLGTQIPALILALGIAVFWLPPTHVPDLTNPTVIEAIAAIATLGALGTGVAYLIYFWLIYHVGATRTSLVTYLLPCTALIWGLIFLGEQIAWYTIVGLALVLFGTMVTNGTIRFARRRRAATSVEVASSGGAVVGVPVGDEPA
jgi:drug/metabolite transporter (DMT)-like permease